MTLTRTIVALGVLAAVSLPLGAQVGAACVGPGAAFGITAYQCASCGFRRDSLGRQMYTFNAEPVVTEAMAGTIWRPGDVVARVGSQPITTAEGAASFAYPFESSERIVGPLIIVDGVAQAQPTSRMAITIRRGNALLTTTQPLLARCADSTGREAMARDTARWRLRDWSRPQLDRRYRITIDSLRLRLNLPRDSFARSPILNLTLDSLRNRVLAASQATENTSRFGFALACDPSCTKARAGDGTEYWKFDGYPRVAALRPNGPAAWAGLKVGDRVTDVEDVSILAERGALNFLHSETRPAILLTVLRDGKKEKLMIAAVAR